MTRNGKPFYGKLWREAEPIALHLFIVIIVEIGLTIIGLLTHLLEVELPKQEDHLSLIETIDIWIALALLSMFGAYTLIQVAIRLSKALGNELSHKTESISEAEP